MTSLSQARSQLQHECRKSQMLNEIFYNTLPAVYPPLVPLIHWNDLKFGEMNELMLNKYNCKIMILSRIFDLFHSDLTARKIHIFIYTDGSHHLYIKSDVEMLFKHLYRSDLVVMDIKNCDTHTSFKSRDVHGVFPDLEITQSNSNTSLNLFLRGRRFDVAFFVRDNIPQADLVMIAACTKTPVIIKDPTVMEFEYYHPLLFNTKSQTFNIITNANISV